jgi:hypothetical protein
VHILHLLLLRRVICFVATDAIVVSSTRVVHLVRWL